MANDGDWRVQVNVKLDDGTLVNVRADSPDELWYLVENVAENGSKVANLASHLNGVGVVQKSLGGETVQHNATPPWDTGQPSSAGGGGVVREQNKWGGEYELNRPDAKMTPWGPAVLKAGKSQAGKHYKRWIDPRSKEIPSNYAKGIRDDPQDKWDGEFFNG